MEKFCKIKLKYKLHVWWQGASEKKKKGSRTERTEGEDQSQPCDASKQNQEDEEDEERGRETVHNLY